MPDLTTVLSDPTWFPLRFERQSGMVMFARLDRGAIRALTFIAEHQPAASDVVTVRAQEIARAPLEGAPLHFIFHSAFVRSTLLTRALDLPGCSFALSEPGILSDLAHAGEQGRQLVEPVLRLLARPFGESEAVIVKPSNAANGLIPEMLRARGNARALLLTGSLTGFLRSINKKGLMGRRWARQLFRHVQRFAPLDLGMSEEELFQASDMQVAGLAWFLQQRQFAMLLASQYEARLASLDSDRFQADPGEALDKLADFFALDPDRAALRAIAEGPVFATHAKSGGDFAQQVAEEDRYSSSPISEEEIALVGRWIAQIADQAGIASPLGRALL